jgi:hypothetical protein
MMQLATLINPTFSASIIEGTYIAAARYANHSAIM